MKKVDGKKIPFFKTKLLIPQINESVIKRKNIFNTLENYLDLKIIFISSPAGFGKTIVLSQWIEFKNIEKDIIWISLDFDDNIIDNFFTYFIQSFSSILSNKDELNNFRDDYDLNYTISVILDKLNILNSNIIIILDNYHYISNEEIHKKLSLFIKNSSNKVHFIFSSRNEIPNSFLNFRYKYKILEINAEQLLFTKEEISDFFSQYNFYLNEEDIDIIKTKMNGWPLSLKTMILSISDSIKEKNNLENNNKFIPLLLENIENKYLEDFLLNEVLINLNKDTLDFLFKTSILNMFNVSLANKLLNINNSYKFIEEIQKKQLFLNTIKINNSEDLNIKSSLIHINNENIIFNKELEILKESFNDKNSNISTNSIIKTDIVWYKYNIFFSKILLNKLKVENNDGYLLLCQKTAKIFKENGNYNESIRYSLLTKNNSFICDVISDLFPLFIKNNEIYKISNIIEKIPKDIILSKTKLAIYYAILLTISYNLDYAEYILGNIENNIENNSIIDSELKTLTNFLNALISFRKNHYIYQIKKYMNLVLKKIHILDSNLLVLVYFYLSSITASTYDFKKSLILSEEGVLQSKKEPNIISLILNKEHSSLILLTEGNLKKSKEILIDILKDIEIYNLSDNKYIINILQNLMKISAYQNDINLFNDYKSKIINLAEKEDDVINKFSFYYSILNCNILIGDLENIEQIITKIEELPLNIDFKVNNPLFNSYLNDLKIYIFIFNNELDKIPKNWEINTKKYINSIFIEKIKKINTIENLYDKTILLVHFYIKKESFIEAIRLLKNLLDFMGDIFLQKKIETYILKAIIYNKQNNKTSAIKSLKKALIISEESNYISFFIRGGNDIKYLLIDICKELKNKNINIVNNYAYNILEHFNKEIGTNLKKSDLDNNLNPLSKKEIEILKLMNLNTNNKDILSNLKISLNTFKTHIKNIYKKLNVNNKQDALKKAKNLDFI